MNLESDSRVKETTNIKENMVTHIDASNSIPEVKPVYALDRAAADI
jgi:hypothetical protein